MIKPSVPPQSREVPINADRLTENERQIVAAAHSGKLTDLGTGDAERDNPANGMGWDGTRTVRAELLIDLLTTEQTSQTPHPRAIKLQGARITGQLDLEARTLICPLLLHDCHIEQPINLDEATAVTIRLPGCHLPALSAVQLRTAGNLELNDGFTAKGEVNLIGARIGGHLNLNGAHLINPDEYALHADRLTVEQGMFCRGGFTTEGEISLIGARIGGSFTLDGAHLINPDGNALDADGLTVEQLLVCREGFIAEGEIRLIGAHIGGQLILDGARLTNPSGYALVANKITVDHSVFCQDGFTAVGQVDLYGARIGGKLDLDGAYLTNPSGYALDAARLTVGQGMFCGFTAKGGVNLLGAYIGGQLVLNGAHLTNPGGYALVAPRLTVEESIFCQDGFTAEGRVNLYGAQISGELSLDGASLSNPNEVVLDLAAARVSYLDLRPKRPPQGRINLTNTQVGAFEDDRATWPTTLLLRGFTYETLENDKIGVRARLRWLKLHPSGYTPQIYDQLAAAYRRAGNTEAVRHVNVVKQWRRRNPLNPFNWLLYLTIGYGYRTWLATVWLGALTVTGSRIFTRAQTHHLIHAGPNAPTFHPVVYTLDTLLPILDLDQQRTWMPYGWAETWSWFLIGAGWFLTTAAVAGLTGIFKRD